MEPEFRCHRKGKKYALQVGLNPSVKHDTAAASAAGKAMHGCGSCDLHETYCEPVVHVFWRQIAQEDPENYGVHVIPAKNALRIVKTLR